MKIKRFRSMVGDFETTVFKGQNRTDVWASALVSLDFDDLVIHHSIDETFEYLLSLKENIVLYYHNLKFDGSFWLDYLMRVLKYKQASKQYGDLKFEWKQEKEMRSKEFKYSISDRGQWYNIIIKKGKYFIELRDSYKLLPFSVSRIAKAFKLSKQKLEMEYKGLRYPGCEITEEEKEYIKNDVLIMKEALNIFFIEGHKGITIGSCCMNEYKNILNKTAYSYDELFPDLTSIDGIEGLNADAWIRKSYKGGWCYYVKGKEGRVFGRGLTADVNSLYPSVMHSESGNRYPVGEPHFWEGNYIPDVALQMNKYYFVKIRTRFYLKEGYLPFIQIKNSYLYKSTECLDTSDVYDAVSDRYYAFDEDMKEIKAELTLTMTDYILMKEHYTLVNPEIVGGCWFYSEIAIFDDYINKYREIKMNSTGAIRELAKLFLNNLYGKLAANDSSSFKYAFFKEDGNIGFYTIEEHNKKAGFIACGSAITSYARNFTIRAAQKNYHGVDKPGFIYADTDSIHCDLMPEDLIDVPLHPNAFCRWKLEACWDEAIFTRQKTYIEHVTHSDGTPVEPYYNIKCAGMPDRCKELFNESLTGEFKNHENEDERDFLLKNGKPIRRTLSDFSIGLKVPGKLMPKRIPGGVLLIETHYEMR